MGRCMYSVWRVWRVWSVWRVRATLAVAVVSVAACCAAAGSPSGSRAGNVQIDNSSEVLARSLRRQLMRDNYDYMSSASEAESPSRSHEKRNRSHDVTGDTIIEATLLDAEVPNNTREQNPTQEEKKDKNVTGKHKDRRNVFRRSMKRRKKLKRYMNADMAARRRARHRYRTEGSDGDGQPPDTQPPTTVKYTLLKVRSGSRRSGLAPALIQEESPHGVALVKLGAGPFPEFRLPAHRRQYMSGPNLLGPLEPLNDEELPPPPLDRSPSRAKPATDTIR